jgi:hypothetical protein
MSAGILLIDGYNLLHAAGMAQSIYRRGDLLRCRTRLLKFLLDKLTAAEIQGTTVIFDARDPPPDRPTQVVVSGIRVLFANPGGDADVLIQSWLARHPAPRRVTLVSSDRLLQRAARSGGSKFVGSEDFVRELERRHVACGPRRGATAPDDDAKPATQASADQTAYWLKIFGDLPIAVPDGEHQAASPAAPPNVPRPKPETPTTGRPGRFQPSRAKDSSKPAEAVGGDELAYWMSVFGGQAGAGASAASSEELRLSDLENWLKEFEAREGNVAKRRKGT